MKTNNLFLTLSVIALCLLQACGGGGGNGGDNSRSASGSAGDPPPSAVQPPSGAFVAASEAGIALQQGLYAVSYGMGSLNSQADKSIWRTTLGGSKDNLRSTVHSVYAGNAEGGNDVLNDILRPTFDPNSISGLGTSISYAWFDDSASRVMVKAFNQSDIEWRVDLVHSDLSGSSLQDFLVTNRSLTKPLEDLAVSGSFATGSRGTRLNYTATADSFFYVSTSPFVQSQADFERSLRCVATSQSPRLATQNHADGTFSIYEIAKDASCSTTTFASAQKIGTGTWTRKVGAKFDYIQLDFPAEVPFSRFDSTFRQQEYEAGIRPIVAITAQRWADGFVVPKGVSFQSRNLALNKVAADSVKTATGL